jgi:hypothetical protein
MLAKGDPADVSTYNNTTDSLEAISDAIPTVGETADQVWDEDRTDHRTANTTGLTLNFLLHQRGLFFKGVVSAQETGSEDTIFYSADLATGLQGFGDGLFKNNYYVQIIKTTDDGAPKSEVRKISAYTSASGKFTVSSAFSANVDINDHILLQHKSIIILSRDDANNIMDSSNVTSNRDGSLPERTEFLMAQNTEIPSEANSKTFNATALASIEAECEDAIEADDLDHLLKLDGATQKYPENCATDSILAKMLVKADPAVPSQFDNSTDSLEAIRDELDNGTYGLSATEVKLDKKLEFGTAVNATSAQPSDNAGTVSYPINLTVTKESLIHIYVDHSSKPANDTMNSKLQVKIDGTNWDTVAQITSIAGATVGTGEFVNMINDVAHCELFINSSTDFRLALDQTGGADGVGTIYYTYNTRENA